MQGRKTGHLFSGIIILDSILSSVRGCYFQEGKKVKKDMSVETGYKKSIESVIHWIGNKVDMNKTTVFFRTYSPVHFRFLLFTFMCSIPPIMQRLFHR